MSVRDDVKATLAAIEPLQRKLSAVDKSWAEIDRVNGVHAARKNELAETEAWLARTRVAAEDATQRLDELSKTCAAEEKRITARIDALKAEMLALEAQVYEKRAELNSVTAGMVALQRRLGAA